jgi:hypothetical protein
MPVHAPGQNGPVGTAVVEAAPVLKERMSSAQDLEVVSPCELIKMPVESIEDVEIVITELKLIHGGHAPEQVRTEAGSKL